MKKLKLDGKIYKKFFSISEQIFMNLDKDISLINIAINFRKIVEITMKSGMAGEDEAYGRAMDYCILDNISVIKDYLDNTKEVEYLKNTYIGIFEILKIENEKVIFLDVSNGKEIEILGEGEGSESSLELDFNVGDLIISRLIKVDVCWYNMKTFYFIKQDTLEKNDFENLKIGYKQIFVGIKDSLDLEVRMELLNKSTNNIEYNDINYLKRIKGILLKPLGKKKLKIIERILNKAEQNSFTESFKIINNVGNISKDDLEKLKEYIVAYLNESVGKKGEKNDKERSKRLQLTINSFFDYLKLIGKEIRTDKKMSEDSIKELEQLKIEWFNTKNHLYSNKTPLDFVHEIDPEYDISDLRMIQTSPEEQGFYDGYNKYFTDSEKEIYEEALKNSIDRKYEDARIGYKKLLKEHSGFFRLRGNYLSVYVNSLIEKYGKEDNENIIDMFSLEELEEDYDFVTNLEYEIMNLDKLKKGYKIEGFDNVDNIVDHCTFIIGLSIRRKRENILNKLIEDGNEDELITRLKYIIPSFDLNEFLNLVKIENSTFIDYDGRIEEGLGYKEDDMWIIFKYLWKKYSNKDDFTYDDIEKLYENIGTIKLNIDGLNKFNKFISLNKKQIKSKKSKIIELFRESIMFGTINDYEKILYIIDNKAMKEDFIVSLNILGVNI